MEIVSALAFKGELLILKEKMINFGLSLDDGKMSKEDSIMEVARCIETLDNIEKLIKFDHSYEG
jgi:hypothetical protein